MRERPPYFAIIWLVVVSIGALALLVGGVTLALAMVSA